MTTTKTEGTNTKDSKPDLTRGADTSPTSDESDESSSEEEEDFEEHALRKNYKFPLFVNLNTGRLRSTLTERVETSTAANTTPTLLAPRTSVPFW